MSNIRRTSTGLPALSAQLSWDAYNCEQAYGLPLEHNRAAVKLKEDPCERLPITWARPSSVSVLITNIPITTRHISNTSTVNVR